MVPMSIAFVAAHRDKQPDFVSLTRIRRSWFANWLTAKVAFVTHAE